ncbi:MAG: hypothetical protein ABR512_10040 [Desulfopila sp.]
MLNINNLGDDSNLMGLYLTKGIDFMSRRPLSNLNESLYHINEEIDEPGETCWRIAHQKEPFDLHELVDDFCNWYDKTSEMRGYQLTTDISSDLPRFFEGNILMLGFLLWDLADFTQTYLGNGEMKLEIHSEPFKRNWHSIYFSFTVPGFGIPLDKEKTLFLPNHKSKTAKKTRVSNLYYAGIIAGAFDGIIRIQNKIDFGTKYILEICLHNKS